MRFIDEYYDTSLIEPLLRSIKKISKKEVRFMEVCGGHTMAIRKFGLPSLLPENIRLLSGPGCPVCVTDRWFIDKAIALARMPGNIITTFGDLVRVPGSSSTLEKEKANGADIRIVYSPLDALALAKEFSEKNIIFLGIGFETTSPAVAVTVANAKKEHLTNFSLLSSHKIMPPAMKAIIHEGIKIDGYICPGHVSTITGPEMYREIVGKYGLGCVISGFEPTDLLQTILMLVDQVESGKPKLEIQYKRAVKPDGNLKAKKIMAEVFETCDDWWRGFGIIPESGLSLNKKYKPFDAGEFFNFNEVPKPEEDKACICGEILKGLKTPAECLLFRIKCNPGNPVGACMVSSEGACHAYYKYQG